MIIIVILLLVAVAAVGAWQYQLSQANALAAQVAIERIQAESRLDLAPWVIMGILIIAVAVVLVFYFRRQPAIVNDNRTVYLMLPDGQSRRQALKALGTYNALLLAPPDQTKQLEKQPMKLLRDGDR